MNSSPRTLTAWASLAALLFTACAGDLALEPEPTPVEDARASSDERPAAIVTVEERPGVFVTTVNAEPDSAWQYFDFETRAAVTPEAPETSRAWDLAFQRFRIKSNGGISGRGGVQVAFVFDQTFDEVASATGVTFVEDRDDGDDPDSAPDYAFNTPHAMSETGWYSYNPQNHTVNPVAMVHLLKTVEGRALKLELVNYYSEAGNPAHPKFRWAWLDLAVPTRAEPE